VSETDIERSVFFMRCLHVYKREHALEYKKPLIQVSAYRYLYELTLFVINITLLFSDRNPEAFINKG
jgi:hypothetical protein